MDRNSENSNYENSSDINNTQGMEFDDNNLNRANVLARDHLFYAMFCRLALAYDRTFPPVARRVLEYFLLITALLALFILIYIHVAFVKSPITCLDHVSFDNLTFEDNTKSDPKNFVIRVEILTNPRENYSLMNSYEKEYDYMIPKEAHFSKVDSISRATSKQTHFLNIVNKRCSKNTNDNLLETDFSLFHERNGSEENLDKNANSGSTNNKNDGDDDKSANGWFFDLFNFPINPILEKAEYWREKLSVKAMAPFRQTFNELELFAKSVFTEEKYIMEYSLEYGLLRLSPNVRERLNIYVHFIVLDANKDKCFGGPMSRFLLQEFVGYDQIIIGSLKKLAEKQNGKGFVRNVVSGEHYRFVNSWMSRTSYLAAGFIMVIFTLSVSMLLRYSHHQIFVFIVDLLRMLENNLQLSFPAAPLLTVVLALVGMEAIMSEFFNDTSTAFYTIVIIWLADQYEAVCCRTYISKYHWPKYFYLYHFAFYAYHYRFNGQFSGLALLCSWLFIQHSMCFFFHHYELPRLLQEIALRTTMDNVIGVDRPRVEIEGTSHTTTTTTSTTTTTTTTTNIDGEGNTLSITSVRFVVEEPQLLLNTDLNENIEREEDDEEEEESNEKDSNFINHADSDDDNDDDSKPGPSGAAGSSHQIDTSSVERGSKSDRGNPQSGGDKSQNNNNNNNKNHKAYKCWSNININNLNYSFNDGFIPSQYFLQANEFYPSFRSHFNVSSQIKNKQRFVIKKNPELQNKYSINSKSSYSINVNSKKFVKNLNLCRQRPSLTKLVKFIFLFRNEILDNIVFETTKYSFFKNVFEFYLIQVMSKIIENIQDVFFEISISVITPLIWEDIHRNTKSIGASDKLISYVPSIVRIPKRTKKNNSKLQHKHNKYASENIKYGHLKAGRHKCFRKMAIRTSKIQMHTVNNNVFLNPRKMSYRDYAYGSRSLLTDIDSFVSLTADMNETYLINSRLYSFAVVWTDINKNIVEELINMFYSVNWKFILFGSSYTEYKSQKKLVLNHKLQSKGLFVSKPYSINRETALIQIEKNAKLRKMSNSLEGDFLIEFTMPLWEIEKRCIYKIERRKCRAVFQNAPVKKMAKNCILDKFDYSNMCYNERVLHDKRTLSAPKCFTPSSMSLSSLSLQTTDALWLENMVESSEINNKISNPSGDIICSSNKCDITLNESENERSLMAHDLSLCLQTSSSDSFCKENIQYNDKKIYKDFSYSVQQQKESLSPKIMSLPIFNMFPEEEYEKIR